jgi:hypothetical protein
MASPNRSCVACSRTFSQAAEDFAAASKTRFPLCSSVLTLRSASASAIARSSLIDTLFRPPTLIPRSSATK